MQIVLYNNTKPLNNIRRSLTSVATLTGTLKEGCNIYTPDIKVEYNSAYIGANYAYIADYGRYYSFTQPPTIEGDTMVLHLSVDVLYTFVSEVLNADCIAERSSSWYDLMVNDSAITEVAGYNFTNYALPYEFRPDQGTYVLMVAGGN